MNTMKDLLHTGVAHDENPPGRGSGRFGWGTGANPGQHQFTLQSEVERLQKNGLSESDIAKALIGEKAKVTDLRAAITIEKNEQKKANLERVYKLYEKTGNASEVGRIMGLSEGTVRNMLKPVYAEKRDKYSSTADMLKKVVDEKGMVDISKYSELYLGCPQYTKDVAVSMLRQQGYVKSWVQVEQVGTNNKTTVTVLAKPGTTQKEIYANRYDIPGIVEYTPDMGKTWWTPKFPVSVDSKRVQVRYAEEGGKEKDGVIEIRRGVEDLSLGGSQYAQVRIAVDGSNYLKGMAMYAEDSAFEKGCDIIYNTNKKKGTPLIDKTAVYNPEDGSWSGKEVSKRMKIDNKTGEVDRDNPFGALIKSPKEKDGIITAGGQREYIDKDGKKKLSPINKLQDEGDWDSWSRNLASQFLSKQPMKLINQQLTLSIDQKKNELEQINQLTNSVVRKKLLADFASGCDANAADLSAKGFKNQAFQVILPIPDLKDNEIYAPNLDDGDTVALVRYPHGGTFEIPILKVNNKHKTAQNVMRGAKDAVGINAHNAEILSGADFDGDTALVIPLKSNKLSVKHTDPLEGLKNFDPKELYKLPDSAPQMKSQTKQTQMGIVTNLITDMTVGGADEDQICRAVKHSMVVIDAEKHHLDYKRSAKDNNIAALQKEWQGTATKKGGASTILSQASSKVYVDQRKEVNRISDMTPEEVKRYNEGYVIYHVKENNKKKVLIKDPDIMTPEEKSRYEAGKKVYRDTSENRQEKVERMYLVDDAMDLVRNPDNPKEVAYANYANELKRLAREARKEYRQIKPNPVSQEAKKTYAKEVDELNAALRTAEMNNPRERKAQGLANAIVEEKFASNPDMDFEHKQRARAVALTQARAMVGAAKERIVLTDSQWEAIQAGAISTDKLTRIVNNCNLDVLKQRATPRGNERTLSVSQKNRIKAMASSGMYTQKEIANALGVSVSSVSNTINE